MTDSLDPVVVAIRTGVLPFETVVAYGRDVDRGIARAWRTSASYNNVEHVLAKIATTDYAVYARAGAAALLPLVTRIDPPDVRREIRAALAAVLRGAPVDWLAYDESAKCISNRMDDDATQAAFDAMHVLGTFTLDHDGYADHALYGLVEHISEALIYPLPRIRREERLPDIARAIVKRVAPPTATILGIL